MFNVFRAYYRKRYMINFEHVPAKGPVIFACNHPNSFLDAMIIGAHIKREVHFLTRSDVFNSPLKLWILSQFKMIPIYRLQEGVENLEKNKTTFDRCQKIFKAGGAVLIFSEGLCIQELRLRPLKKGTARIALDYSKDGSPLTIIPTGLNYLKATQFRKDILVKMNTPFNAADFASEYNDNNSKAIIAFNKKLEAGLRETVIDIQDKPLENDIAQVLYIHHTENRGNLDALIGLTKSINALSKSKDTDCVKLVEKAQAYRIALKKLDIEDEALVAKDKRLWLHRYILMICKPLAHLLFLPPIALAGFIARSKVKRVEFFDSVLVGAIGIFFLFYFLIIATTMTIIFSGTIALATIATLWLIGELGIVGYDFIYENKQQNALAGNREDRELLTKTRSEIKGLSASILNLVKTHKAHHPVG
jgi:1-acyl-sn-glycerol-3-phosphate acyltransferase